MAYYFKIAVVLATIITLSIAEECKCIDDTSSQQANEVWDLLSKKGDEIPFVLPGELASLVPCRNCLEQNRMKRKTEETNTDGLNREERSPATFRVWRHANEARNKCPIGYRRFFMKCVKYGY